MAKTQDPKPKRNPDTCKVLIDTISVNVDNDKLSDAEFRQFIRNSLPTTIDKGNGV